MSEKIYKSLIAFHPGSYIGDIIDDMEITQSEFAKRLDTTDKTLSQLINGLIPLSKDIAKKLSKLTGTSVGLWLNLQKKYDEKCLEIEQNQQLDIELSYLSVLNYGYFKKLNVVPETTNKEEQIKYLCKYLQVSSLRVLANSDLLVACKTAINHIEEKNIVCANAWIQTGMNIAKSMDCSKYSKIKLKAILPKLRSMTLQDTSVFYPKIVKMLASCGIALVALPYLKNSGLNGAVKWINSDKVLLLINDRNKDAGTFWFALFHEIGHILQGQKKNIYLTSNDKVLSLGINNIANEVEADNFAQEILIPEIKYKQFIQSSSFNRYSIVDFANKIQILPAIVLGRLQHDGYLNWNAYSDLKLKYFITTTKTL